MDKNKTIIKNNIISFTGNKFCISVDGSRFSDYGFEIIFNDFFNKGDRIVVTHISNNEKLSNIPFNYQPDTIQNKYETKLIGKLLNSDYSLVFQPKEANVSHAMEQVFNVCKINKCNVLIMGYQGHKSDIQKKELTKGTIFMIQNVHIPTFIIKDQVSRLNNLSGGYIWLAAIENSNSKSFKAFQYSVNFIDIAKDKIIIIHIKQLNENEENLTLEEINNFCQQKKLINFEIRILANDGQSIGKQICSYINFGEENYDFVIVGHNSGKYKNLEASPIIEICKTAEVNILYYCAEDSYRTRAQDISV